MPALKAASSKPFTKVVITKGYGFHTPQDGSVCRIKVISDEMNIITELDDSKEKEIIVGDVDEPIDRIIEDCVRTMKEEEVCCLKFDHPCFTPDCIVPADRDQIVEEEEPSGKLTAEGEKDVEGSDANTIESKSPVDDPEPSVESQTTEDNTESESQAPQSGESVEIDDKSEQPTEEKSEEQTEEKSEKPADAQTAEDFPSSPAEVQFQLLSYTREPEIWEMSVTEKWRRACYHKQRGLELYSRGAYQYAFRRFGLTLKYVISLEHDVPAGQEDGMDIKGLKLSCYLNVAACQMRHHNFESVVANSSKALTLQPNNAKALYRRGSAHLQLQEYEKAKEDLTTAQSLEPKNQAVAKQLQLLKCQVQKLNQYYASAMKKLFT